MSDPRNDPKPGDRLFQHTRTVIYADGDTVLFGIDIRERQNCGTYVTSLTEWKKWSALAYDKPLNELP